MAVVLVGCFIVVGSGHFVNSEEFMEFPLMEMQNSSSLYIYLAAVSDRVEIRQ